MRELMDRRARDVIVGLGSDLCNIERIQPRSTASATGS